MAMCPRHKGAAVKKTVGTAKRHDGLAIIKVVSYER
jgi:hypothetical protein